MGGSCLESPGWWNPDQSHRLKITREVPTETEVGVRSAGDPDVNGESSVQAEACS